MQLKHIMRRRIESVGPENTLTEAARKMVNHRAGILAVRDGRRLVGVLTASDLIVRTTSERRDPVATPVREVMGRRFVACRENEDAEQALQIMRLNRVTQVWIFDGRDELSGVVLLRDVLPHARRASKKSFRTRGGRRAAAQKEKGENP